MPEDHDAPLRVSGIQSGNQSGPVGSTSDQQEVFPGQRVREEQPRSAGHLVLHGARRDHLRDAPVAAVDAALWLCGFEEVPAESGEICEVEVFGDAVDPGPSAEVGIGLEPIRDPRLAADFAAPRLPIDVAEPHRYAVDWDAAEAAFRVDGEVVRRCSAPPTYPLQLRVAVFDFPARSDGTDGHLVPELVVDTIVSQPA